jgi:hypothetical protein
LFVVALANFALDDAEERSESAETTCYYTQARLDGGEDGEVENPI